MTDRKTIIPIVPVAATATGERYDPARHQLAHEVKAITQHELMVDRGPNRCTATYIVDI